MLLHCTLVRGPRPGEDSLPVELSIDIPEDATGLDVETAVSRRFGTTGLSVAGVPLATIGVVADALAQGVVLLDSSTATRRQNTVRRRKEPDQPILSLVVHSGAGAGTVFPLKRGTYRIGRSGADIVIADPKMSREHARLEVSETSVTIFDQGSANGTLVDGRRRRGAVISTDSTIRCGDSFMTISSGAPFVSRQYLEEAGASVTEEVPVSANQQQSNRATLLITAVAPLVIGVGLALVTGMWMFLAFSAMSGIAVLVPVLSGRRQRRDFQESLNKAVQQDQSRRRRAAPSVAELLFADPAEQPDRPWHPSNCGGAWLRIGQGEQAANIKFEPSSGGEASPSAGLLPVTLDPGTPLTTVRGPAPLRSALIRSLLVQLAYIPRAACTRVVVHGDVDQLPLAARFLANVQLSSDVERTCILLDAGTDSGMCNGILLLTESPQAPTGLADYAIALGWQVLHFLPSGSDGAVSDVELNEHSSFFTDAVHTLQIIPDLVGAPVFDRAARARKTALARSRETTGIPANCSLDQILSTSSAAIGERWANGRSASGLRVPLGIAMDGTRFLDLEADGPHVLVAGTTGSGKSELLRSLAAALALCYPPDRVNFLFVDFKGGSGLAPLAGLPHCVGLLTDLSPDELDRFLASLRSEIRRRERLLAAAEAPDLGGYRQSLQAVDNPIPQLMVIIDEFRMLVEDAPAALGELMRIATIGRSLGLHLIMATQRPQGAITADIRANVTTSIALRVQSEMESFDVINSKLAAGIDLSTPGRAFLSRGAEVPEEFQAASIAQAHTIEKSGASVQLAQEAVSQRSGLADPPTVTSGITPAVATAPLVKAVSLLWSERNGRLPRRPVAASLPAELDFTGQRQEECLDATEPAHPSSADEDAVPVTDTVSVCLGILDKPDEQRLAPLVWSPQTQGHLALVGSPAVGGQGTLLILAIEQLLRQSAESHLYLLDGQGSFDRITARGRIGAKASVHELRRGVRIMERIHEEMTSRLSRPAGERGTRLVVVIAGWGAWVSALRSGPLMWAEDLVQDIVRDGSHANITVLVSGEREVVTSRFFPAVQNRIYCPAGSTEESRLAWPAMPRTPQIPGRAVAFGPVSFGGPSVCQLYTSGPRTVSGTSDYPDARPRPFRVEPLPATLGAEFVARLVDANRTGEAARANGPAGGVQCSQTGSPSPEYSVPGRARQRQLILGIGGDELEPVALRFPAGSVLAVLGRPGSGRSNVARSLPAMNPELNWIAPGPHDDPPSFWATLHASTAHSVNPTGICLVDDADHLPASTNQLLLDLNAKGLSVAVTGTYSPVFLQRVPVAMAARSGGAGLLLAPRALSDGDVFGTRFEVEAAPAAGRAVLIADGQAAALQLPYLPEAGGNNSVTSAA